jgi:hypothetical protein
MVDVALAASPSEARPPLPPVPSVEEGCAVGMPEVPRAAAASGTPVGGVGSSIPASATEPASATDPLSAPAIDDESGWSKDSEEMVRFGLPGSFFVVAIVSAGRPGVDSASGSGGEMEARSESGRGGELRTGSGLGARSEPAAGVAVEAGIVVGVAVRLGVATWVAWDGDAFEASGGAEAWRSAPRSAAAAPSAVPAGAWASEEPPISAGAVAPAAAAAPDAVAAGASAAGATAGPDPTPDAASALDGEPGDVGPPDAASSVDGEPGGLASPREVTRTRAGVPM